MNRTALVNGITHYLTHLSMKIRLLNSLNLQDDNIHAENFFRDMLNLAFGYRLVNINIIEKNTAAIDLGDEENRIAIQVTSTSNISKIKHTHSGFLKNGLDHKYDRLVVLIIGEKQKYRVASVPTKSDFPFSLDDDVWGVTELLRKFADLPTTKLLECRDFLRAELRVGEHREANEVNTLMKLIETLSSVEDGLLLGDNREDPDPNRKIYDRFADHVKFLESQYVDLHEIYGQALAEVNRHSDLSHVRVRKLQVYLARWSDQILNESGGDPQVALNVLTTNVLKMMGGGDHAFDDSAVRYYLTDQLIACNVFPNKRPIHA